MTLEEIFSAKLTENGDIAFAKVSDNKMLNILFMTEYYQKHLHEVPYLDNSEVINVLIFKEEYIIYTTCFDDIINSNISHRHQSSA